MIKVRVDNDVRRILEKNKQRNIAMVREVAKGLSSEIVKATPYDTGRLRAGWDIAVGGISDVATGGYVQPQNEASVSFDKNGSTTSRRLRKKAEQLKSGQNFAFMNNVRYAKFVEFGTVYMKPRAMTRKALSKLPLIVQKAAAKVRQR